MVATICARFGGYPSEYYTSHDWSQCSLDYETATVLNEIDQKKEEEQYKALSGKG